MRGYGGVLRDIFCSCAKKRHDAGSPVAMDMWRRPLGPNDMLALVAETDSITNGAKQGGQRAG